MKLIVYRTSDGAVLRNISCPASDAAKQAKAGEAWLETAGPVNPETHQVNLSTLEIEEI